MSRKVKTHKPQVSLYCPSTAVEEKIKQLIIMAEAKNMAKTGKKVKAFEVVMTAMENYLNN